MSVWAYNLQLTIGLNLILVILPPHRFNVTFFIQKLSSAYTHPLRLSLPVFHSRRTISELFRATQPGISFPKKRNLPRRPLSPPPHPGTCRDLYDIWSRLLPRIH